MLSMTRLMPSRSASPRPARAPRRSSRGGRRDTTSCRRRRRAARRRRSPRRRRTRARVAGSVPARRTLSRPTVTRSARAPGSMRPASGQPSARVAAARRRAAAGRRPVAAALAASRAARRARPRAPPRTGRSPRASRCRARATRRRPPAAASRRCRRRGRARSSGRRSSTRPHRRAPRRRRPSRCVACTAVKRASSAPAPASSAVGVLPYASTQAAFSAGCSDTCACSGRPRSRAQLATTRRRVRVDRAHAVDGGAHARGVPVLAQVVDALGPGLRAPVREAELRALGRRADAAVEVAGVEQRDAHAGLGGRRDQHAAHLVRVVVAGAAGGVVQVVELADRGDARQRHLGVGRAREREVAVRVEPLGERVHLLAPGPERAAAVLGAAAQGALERVRVGVGEAGQREPVEAAARPGAAPCTPVVDRRRSGRPRPRRPRPPRRRSPPSQASSHQ